MTNIRNVFHATRPLFLFPALLLAVLIIVSACGTTSEPLTIGVVNISTGLDVTLDGFKESIAEAGFVEGENVTYIYEGASGGIQGLGPAIAALRAAGVDLIFSITTPASIAVKRSIDGTDVPGVFAPVLDPVKSGLVESLRQPGGNMTGVKAAISLAKGLEWHIRVAPNATRIFVPYNTADEASVLAFAALEEAALSLGVELMPIDVQTADELVAALDAIPESATGIYVLPIGILTTHETKIAAAALERRLPLSGSNSQLPLGGLMSYSIDIRDLGVQAGRLAAKILNGADPADLPVEQARIVVTINLKTAQAIGLTISDIVLQQADVLIR
ncbi:MAG: ABC transporter substrate-binding protein [Chloroflexi bacterium]|nr:ABC transporter substrate-binding protein [Chloroflexota bacterium]